jgi:hypothetical protein
MVRVPDHFLSNRSPEFCPEVGKIPPTVNSLVRTTPLTKSLMYGGSGLNLMYLNTFEGLGLARNLLKTNPCPIYGVVLGKQSTPLG